MGIFNFLKYNDLESRLLDQYTEAIQIVGFSKSEARRNAEEMLDRVIKEAKSNGTYYLPQNMGDIILGDSECDDALKPAIKNIRKKIPAKKKEGVKDEDIRIWWNLHEIERGMMVENDNLSKAACFIGELRNYEDSSGSAAQKKAGEKVRECFPMFGDPNDTKDSEGDDRPLPAELKIRINEYISKRIMEDPEKYKNDIEKSSTYNALIRREIKKGEL